MSAAVCSHLDTIEFTAIPDSVVGCEECLKIGSRWVHLRMCLECGKSFVAEAAVYMRGPGSMARCRARGERLIVLDVGLAALEREV